MTIMIEFDEKKVFGETPAFRVGRLRINVKAGRMHRARVRFFTFRLLSILYLLKKKLDLNNLIAL